VARASQRRALVDHFARAGVAATVEDGLHPAVPRVRYALAGRPVVSVVVITAGQTRVIDGRTIDLLANCVQSIVRATTRDDYEIICVHNGDLSPATAAAVEGVAAAERARRPGTPDRVRLVTFAEPFSVSGKYNLGARHARGDHLLFMNDDIEAASDDWIWAMAEYSQQPEVGAVGAKLHFPSGAIQHAGVKVHDGGAGHVYYCKDGADPGPFFDAVSVRNYSAVTGACMMTRRAVFEQMGGFDPDFPVNFQDVHYCLQVREAGYRIVFTPYARLVHFESLSRFGGAEPAEYARLAARWKEKAAVDPYFNPMFR
jgi:GT2 family glycosyltransferase